MPHYFDMPLDYMTKRVRDLPDVAEAYRTAIRDSEEIIRTLEASLAVEQRRRDMYERKLDTIQTQIHRQLRQAGIMRIA